MLSRAHRKHDCREQYTLIATQLLGQLWSILDNLIGFADNQHSDTKYYSHPIWLLRFDNVENNS